MAALATRRGPVPSPQQRSAAEEWIVESVRELRRPFKLVIYLTAAPTYEAAGLRDALHNHFRYRLWSTARHYEQFRSDGWTKLAIGLGFLFSCLLLRQLLLGALAGGLLAAILQEGLLILGWVAMWGPVEALLYQWWPIRREAALYRQLSVVDVEVRAQP